MIIVMKVSVSVLIGTRNRVGTLLHCLESIVKQDYSNFEVIVLDDGSDHVDVCEVIGALADPRIRCIKNHKPLGVAEGRNQLMNIASGDVFFVIDDDAYFEYKSSLSKVVAIFSEKPDVGIVACKVQNHGIIERAYNVPFRQKVLKKDPTIIERAQYVGYFLGTAHAIRKDMVNICGGYNTDLFFGGEELELSYRAISKEWKIWYEPSILVHHVPQPSVVGKGHGYEELYHNVKNRFYLAWRYLPSKYMFSYICIWVGKQFLDAAKHDFWGAYIKGIVAGLRTLKVAPREPLGEKALQYLKKNFGRLWY